MLEGITRPRRVNGAERRYETPTYSPGGAFATTLRSAEIARLECEQQLDVFAYAA